MSCLLQIWGLTGGKQHDISISGRGERHMTHHVLGREGVVLPVLAVALAVAVAVLPVSVVVVIIVVVPATVVLPVMLSMQLATLALALALAVLVGLAVLAVLRMCLHLLVSALRPTMLEPIGVCKTKTRD
jgi:hypothetical protein